MLSSDHLRRRSLVLLGRVMVMVFVTSFGGCGMNTINHAPQPVLRALDSVVVPGFPFLGLTGRGRVPVGIICVVRSYARRTQRNLTSACRKTVKGGNPFGDAFAVIDGLVISTISTF